MAKKDISCTKEEISTLELQTKIIEKLKNKNLNTIGDVWVLKRKELKELGFTDNEIKSIIISLQLKGLDLNKKIYD